MGKGLRKPTQRYHLTAGFLSSVVIVFRYTKYSPPLGLSQFLHTQSYYIQPSLWAVTPVHKRKLKKKTRSSPSSFPGVYIQVYPYIFTQVFNSAPAFIFLRCPSCSKRQMNYIK